MLLRTSCLRTGHDRIGLQLMIGNATYSMDIVQELFLSQKWEHQQPSAEGEATEVRVEDGNSDGDEDGPE